MNKYLYIVLLMLAICPGVTMAGGFQINEHGARAMGLGGAFTAIANDASSIYWNNAGMTQLSGTNFMLGTALIAPSSEFRGVTPAADKNEMESDVFFPSHFFITHSINKSLALGIGITTPFGLGTEWSAGWVGRYLALKTQLTTFWVPVTAAYQLLDNLSVGASFVYSFADVTITQNSSQAPFEGDAYVDLDGSDPSAFGYTFGIMYKPSDIVSIGAAFRSEISYDFEGTATTTGAEQLMEIGALPNGDISAELTTPMNIVGGVAVQVIPELLLSADFQWIGWSSYDTLAVDFVDESAEDLASPRLYKDTYIIRFGAQYNISKSVSLLGGIYYDQMPVEPAYVNPSLPDTDRLGISIGAEGKITEQFGISGSYLFIRGSQLEVTDSQEIYTTGDSPFNGTYNSSANLLSLSLNYYLQ